MEALLSELSDKWKSTNQRITQVSAVLQQQQNDTSAVLQQMQNDTSAALQQMQNDVLERLEAISREISAIRSTPMAVIMQRQPLPEHSASAATTRAPGDSTRPQPAEASVAAQTPARPQVDAEMKAFRLSRTIATITQLHKEWYQGIANKRSVVEANKKWAAKWRATDAERKFYARRYAIIKQVTRFAALWDCTEDCAAQRLEQQRRALGKSLDRVAKALIKGEPLFNETAPSS